MRATNLPPRSMLFMPADKPRMAAKIPEIAADLAVLDLEDAVVADKKQAARHMLLETLADGSLLRTSAALAVRINEVGSDWFADDLACMAEVGRAHGGQVGIVLPKAESPDQVAAIREALGDVHIVVGLESGAGVAEARAIMADGVDGCYFGAEDYIADLGGRRTEEGLEVLYARSHVVLAARLAGCFSIDQAVLAVRDDVRFRADATQGRELGYSGKICLHPQQVAIVNELLTPTAEEVLRARCIIDAAAAGGGVGILDGQMVDQVHVRQAEAVLARADVT